MPRLPLSEPLSRRENPLTPPVSTAEHQESLADKHSNWRTWGDVPSDPPNPPADGSMWLWHNTASDQYKVKLGDGTVSVIAPSSPAGAAGGDLFGTYPNPSVYRMHDTGGTLRVNTASGALTNITLTGRTLFSVPISGGATGIVVQASDFASVTGGGILAKFDMTATAASGGASAQFIGFNTSGTVTGTGFTLLTAGAFASTAGVAGGSFTSVYGAKATMGITAAAVTVYRGLWAARPTAFTPSTGSGSSFGLAVDNVGASGFNTCRAVNVAPPTPGQNDVFGARGFGGAAIQTASGTANAAVTVTAGPPGTLTDTRLAMATNAWQGATLTYNGTITGRVYSNTATTFTIVGSWSSGPGANGSAWSITTGPQTGTLVSPVAIHVQGGIFGSYSIIPNVVASDLHLLGDSGTELLVKRQFKSLVATLNNATSGRINLSGAPQNLAGSTDLNYKVQIQVGGTFTDDTTPVTYRWSSDNGATWTASNLVPSEYDTLLEHGIQISFNQGFYTALDQITFTAIASGNQITLVQADTTNDVLNLRNVSIAATTAVQPTNFSATLNYTGVTQSAAAQVRLNLASTAPTTGVALRSDAYFNGAVASTLTAFIANVGNSSLGVNVLGRGIQIVSDFTTATPTNSNGLLISDMGFAVGTIASVIALNIAEQTAGTATYQIKEDATIGYNVLAGDTRIGGTTDPTVACDVTGAALFSSTVGITGALTLTTKLAIAQGGTGQATATLAFNALSPVTTRGDLITRDATNNVRLALSVPAANVLNVLAVANGEVDTSWKAVLDGTNPAAIGTAAPGTSLIFSHRDHVHAGVATAFTASNWKVFYSNGSGVVTELTVGAASTVLVGNGATSAPTFSGTPQLTSIGDTGGTTRYTPATASPHNLFTGDTQLGVSGSTVGVNVAPSTVNTFSISPVNTSPTATSTILAIPTSTFPISTNGVALTGFSASLTYQPSAAVSTGQAIGMSFVGTASHANIADSSAATMSILTGGGNTVTAGNLATSSTSRTLNITTMTANKGGMTFLCGGTSSTSEILNVTTAATFLVIAPTFTVSGTTPQITITNLIVGMDVPAVAKSAATTVVTNAWGIRIGDITGTSFTAATTKLLSVGYNVAVPYLEVMGAFVAAANVTPVWISEGATPTRRQVQTKAGNTLVAGDLVVVLV